MTEPNPLTTLPKITARNDEWINLSQHFLIPISTNKITEAILDPTLQAMQIARYRNRQQ